MSSKIKSLLIFFLLFTSAMTICLHAEDINFRHSLTAGINFWRNTASEKEFENSIGFRVNYFYNITNKASISAGLFYFAPNNKGIIIPPGTTKILPLIFDFQYAIAGEKFKPFIAGGISLILVDYKLSENTINAYKNLGFNISTESKNALGINIGGGLDIAYSEKYSIIIDGYYMQGKSDFVNSITDIVSGLTKEQTNKINLNSFIIGAGIKFNL